LEVAEPSDNLVVLMEEIQYFLQSQQLVVVEGQLIAVVMGGVAVVLAPDQEAQAGQGVKDIMVVME